MTAYVIRRLWQFVPTLLGVMALVFVLFNWIGGDPSYLLAGKIPDPERIDGEGTWGNAHNVYLHQLAERGVPGLLFLLAAMWAFLSGAWRTARARADSRSLWAATAAAAFIVMNFTEVAWQTEQVVTF